MSGRCETVRKMKLLGPDHFLNTFSTRGNKKRSTDRTGYGLLNDENISVWTLMIFIMMTMMKRSADDCG